MNKLDSKVVVVAGGTGRVGEAIVKVFLEEGATVVVPARSTEKAEQLNEYVETIKTGRLITFPARVGEITSAHAFKETVVQELGRVDLAVASLGSWVNGWQFSDLPQEEWDKVMNNNLTSHSVFARTFVPVLREQNNGVYVLINGGAQEHIIPSASVMSIVSMAQTKMAEVLHHEAKDKNYRVYSVAAYTPLVTRDMEGEVKENWVTAEELGRYIVSLYTKEAANANELMHKLMEHENA